MGEKMKLAEAEAKKRTKETHAKLQARQREKIANRKLQKTLEQEKQRAAAEDKKRLEEEEKRRVEAEEKKKAEMEQKKVQVATKLESFQRGNIGRQLSRDKKRLKSEADKFMEA